MAQLTAERLREALLYDAGSGLFTWAIRTGGTASIGRVAGTMDSQGYTRIGIDGHVYRAHRLAWLFVTGDWPANEIDHIDGNKSNNQLSNLRDVSRQMNQQNQRRPHKRGGSGSLGVSMHQSTGKWRARIWTNGKNKSLGLFDTKDMASAAYAGAKREHHEGSTL
jgi:hypothetical protein